MGKIDNFMHGIFRGNDTALSFSQCGEDRIMYFLANTIGLVNPSYLDIGAFDPWFINNTALFYKTGSRGWNIEPNKSRHSSFLKERPKDINLNIGIAGNDGSAMFYQMKHATLSTFSENEYKRLTQENQSALADNYEVKVLTLRSFIDQYCRGTFPDILNLDVEGLDEVIINDMKQLTSLPSIICAETAVHLPEAFGPKKNALIHVIEELGYHNYADTHINTIFLRNDLWKKQAR